MSAIGSPRRSQPYLPLSNTRSTTKVAHEIRTLRNIGQVQRERFCVLIHDDHRELSVFCGGVDSVCVGSITVRKVDLNTSGTEVGAGAIQTGQRGISREGGGGFTLDRAKMPTQLALSHRDSTNR
jgi:hypothetical protein